MINPGKMDRRLLVERRRVTSDAFNAATVRWERGRKPLEIYAERKDQRGAERDKSGKLIGEQEVIWRTRYRREIKSMDRLFDPDEEETYDIQYIRQIGRRHYMDIVTILHRD